jgi:hypothetical protein
MKQTIILNFFLMILTLQGCSSSPIAAIGSKTVSVFSGEVVNWGHSEAKSPIKANDKGIIRLSGGRILLKKITLPHHQKSTQVNAKLTLVSNGDPWDKSGSLFVLPKASVANLLTIQQEQQQFPDFAVGDENFPGVALANDYLPTLELVRFMTPFGVGFFSDSPKLDQRKPVYIPHWEKEVLWHQDISDRLKELQGEVWIGVWIDVWTKEGYKINLDLSFDETEFIEYEAKKTWTKPLINTINYFGPMKYPDFFSRNDLLVDIDIPENVTNVELKYIATGHGGHEGGDEFVKKEHVISVDGQELQRFTPWRDDCAAFRRFNPHSGVWTEKIQWKDKEIDERIASSDYSRSNWCPGSDVTPLLIPLSGLSPGRHQLKFSVPDAQAIKENELNHWLISAYLVGEIKE